jgi:putative transposase
MPRRPRCATGGFVYHVLNRSVGRATLFDRPADYAAFEKVLRQAQDWLPVRLLAYCIMPYQWHLVPWPERDGDLSEHLRWLTVTHTQRWHAHRHTAGTGPLYQGRFKAFPVQEDEHLLPVCRYVERNPLRAGLVKQAEAWRWGSLWQRLQGGPMPLAPWPVPVPADCPLYVNRPESAAELHALRRCVVRGAPYGDGPWQLQTARTLRLEAALRPLGRPRKHSRMYASKAHSADHPSPAVLLPAD